MPPLAVCLPAFASSDYRSNLQIEGHSIFQSGTQNSRHTQIYCHGSVSAEVSVAFMYSASKQGSIGDLEGLSRGKTQNGQCYRG